MNQLKDKLLKFDDYDMKLIRLIKAENQACLRIAEYQFNKDSKIISALLEIIEMQDKDLKNATSRLRGCFSGGHDFDDLEQTISETKQKLDELIKGE